MLWALFALLGVAQAGKLFLTGTYRDLGPTTPSGFNPAPNLLSINPVTDRPVFSVSNNFFDDIAGRVGRPFTITLNQAVGSNLYTIQDTAFNPFGSNNAFSLELTLDVSNRDVTNDTISIEHDLSGASFLFAFMGIQTDTINTNISSAIAPWRFGKVIGDIRPTATLTSFTIRNVRGKMATPFCFDETTCKSWRFKFFLLRPAVTTTKGIFRMTYTPESNRTDVRDCSGDTNGIKLLDLNNTFVNFDVNPLGNVFLRGEATIITSSTEIRLVAATSSPLSTGQAWRAGKVDIISGFTTQFDFVITQPNITQLEGFAFVFQNDINQARGDSAAGLGYSSIKNAVAIEFDLRFSGGSDQQAVNATNGQHCDIAASTAVGLGVLSNSITGATRFDGTTAGGTLLQLVGTHTARISFSFQTGVVLAVIDGVPRATRTLDRTLLSTLFPDGFAFLGFTSGLGSAGVAGQPGGEIKIRNWQILTVPNVAARSVATHSSVTKTYVALGAPETPQIQVQAKNACGQNMRSGGATVVQTFSKTATFQGFTSTDLTNGKYDIRFFHSTAEVINVTLLLNNEKLDQSPEAVTIVPGAISPAHCNFTGVPDTLTFVAGTTTRVTVAIVDQFFNQIQGASLSQTQIGSIVAALSTGDQTVKPLTPFIGNNVLFDVRSDVADSNAAFTVRIGALEVGALSGSLLGLRSISPVFNVIIAPGALRAAQSEIQLSLRSVAGTNFGIKAIPRDVFLNNIRTDAGLPAPQHTFSPSLGVSATIPVFNPLQDPLTASWNVTANATIVGNYNYIFTVGTESWTNNFEIIPGEAEPRTSKICNSASFDNTNVQCLTGQNLQDTSLLVGVPGTSFTIFTVDAFNNRRTTVVTGNLIVRITAPGGGVFNANCTTGVVGAITGVIEGISCAAARTGSYKVDFLPLRIGTYTVQVFVNTFNAAQLFTGGAVTFTAFTNIPDATKSTIVLPVNSGTPIKAGDVFNVLVAAKDAFLNPVVVADTVLLFSFAMLGGVTPVIFPNNRTVIAATGVHTASFVIQTAGQLVIDVRFSNQALSNSPTSPIVVIPAATFGPTSQVFGTALVGGTQGNNAVISFEARDRFGNLQLATLNERLSLNATFRLVTSNGATSLLPLFTPQGTNGPLYTLNFPFPASFDLCIRFAGVPACGTKHDCVGGTNTACDGIVTFSAGATDSDAKAQWNVQVPNKTFRATDQIQFLIIPTTNTFDQNPRVVFVANGTQANIPADVTCQGNCLFTSLPTSFTATVRADASKLLGLYTLSILHVGLGEIRDANNQTFLPLTITAGEAAQPPFSFLIQKQFSLTGATGHSERIDIFIRDRFGNPIAVLSDAEKIALDINVKPCSSLDVGCAGSGTIRTVAARTPPLIQLLNDGNGAWHFFIDGMTQSGSMTILMTLEGVPEEFSFVVSPATLQSAVVISRPSNIDFTNPTINTLPVAGNNLAICIIARDTYGNIITDPAFANNFAVNLAETATAPFADIRNVAGSVNSNDCDGYAAVFVPTKIHSNPDPQPGTELFFVVFARSNLTAPLPGTPTPIYIASGDADPTKSECIIVGNPFRIPNQLITFDFVARDTFGNLLTQTIPGGVTVNQLDFVVNAGPTFFSSTDGISPPEPLGFGKWKFDHITTLATTELNLREYSYAITLNGETRLDGGASNCNPVHLSAGPAFAQNTQVEQTAPIEAGTTGVIQMTLFDGTENINRVDENGLDIIEVKILKRNSPEPRCVDGEPNPAIDVTNAPFMSPVVFGFDGTFHTIEVSSTVADEYILYLKVNGEFSFVVCEFPPDGHAFTVIPSVWSPVDSFADTNDAAIAGAQERISVHMVDRFGNQLTYEGFLADSLVGLQVGDPVDIVVGSTPAVACDIPDLLVVPPGNIVDNRDGTFIVNFRATLARDLSVVVTVQGQRIGPDTPCDTIVVSPSYIFQFTADLTPGPKVTATEVFGQITGFDEFNNEVIGGAHHFTILGVRDDDNTYPVRGHAFFLEVPAEGAFKFVPEWPGTYSLTFQLVPEPQFANLALSPSVGDFIDFTAVPVTCKELNIGSANNHTCPAGNCAATYALCLPQVAAFALSCTNACPQGHCANGTQVCPAPIANCASPCADGTCATEAPCASTFLPCPTGSARCPDGRSCATSLANCLAVSVNCPSGKGVCPDGSCVDNVNDCATTTTCEAGLSLCPDGSCEANIEQCGQINVCPAPLKLCADSSCRTNAADCPTHITCPKGFLKCEAGHCVTSLNQCPTPPTCTAIDSFRCSDGTCRNNWFLCPSVTSCLAPLPVRCHDGQCVATRSQCKVTNQCPHVTCPDGSCAGLLAECPVATSCSYEVPVLCPDGSCRATEAACPPTVDNCLINDVRCADGSCRNRIEDCPSPLICPASIPVRCPDGQCATGTEACSTSFGRTLNQAKRCPGGTGFADSYDRCPTQTTCSFPKIRCIDGTCRTSAECADASFLSDFVPCPVGTFPCPQPGQSVVCVADISQCANEIVCPLDKPVRCIDASCAFSVEECPLAPSAYAPRVACPDGTWAVSSQFCGVSVRCDSSLPVKCWDRSCRANVEDCPPQPPCPEDRPFLCSTGECTADISHCLSSSCGGFPGAFMCSHPKLSGAFTCTNSCDDALLAVLPFRELHRKFYRTGEYKKCPIPTVRCSDGTCLRKASCPNYRCPEFLPFVCPTGKCVKTESQCPELSTLGCQPPNTVRCFDGVCVPDISFCTQAVDEEPRTLQINVNVCPVHRPVKCPDGLCAKSSASCVVFATGLRQTCSGLAPVTCADQSCAASGAQCPPLMPCVNEFPVRCPSGECARLLSHCVGNVTRCPSALPFLCDDGLCVSASSACLGDAGDLSCPAGFPRCANGACTNTTCGGQPTVVTLGTCAFPNQIRCANGSCGSLVNPCPVHINCPAGPRRFLCADGSCVSESKFCPLVFPCPDGTAPCFATGMTCTKDCASANSTLSCPPSQPTKCIDGTCRRTLHDCENRRRSLCPEGQFRCSNGSCNASPRQCIPAVVATFVASRNLTFDVSSNVDFLCASFGTKAVMCWNGLCAPNRQSCTAIPECPVNTRRCADGACHPSVTSCNAVSIPGCNPGLKRCVDGLCRAICPGFHGCDIDRHTCVQGRFKCALNPAACTGGAIAPESCANCQHDVPAIPQRVFIPVARSVTIDVSLDENNVPGTQLIVPSGAFGRDSVLEIHEVPTSTLGVGLGSGNQERDFTSIVLSTPFTCSSDVIGNNALFPLNVTISGAIDRFLFAANNQATSAPNSVPCEFQGDWTDLFATFANQICQLNYFVTPTGLSLNSCGKQGLTQSYTLRSIDQDQDFAQASDLIQANINIPNFVPAEPVIFDPLADTPTSLRCLCFDIFSQTDSTDPETLAKADITSACITMVRKANTIQLWQSAVPALLNKCLPPSADQADPLFEFSELTKNDLFADACAETGAIQEMNPLDICLGSLNTKTKTWSCLQGFFERVDFPSYSPQVGGPRNRAVGRITNCGPTYAFIFAPLGAAPIAFVRAKTFWELYGTTILIITGCFLLFAIIATYVIIRLNRYRIKYLEEKKEQDRLAYRVNELDEFAGGLGVADAEGDVLMMPNPLVLEMQQLEQRKKQMELEAADTAEQDAAHIEQLEAERRAVYAEITRIKGLLDAQQATAPLRTVDTNDTAAYATGVGAVSAVTATSGGPVPSAQPALKPQISKARKDFGGGGQAKKKKSIG